MALRIQFPARLAAVLVFLVCSGARTETRGALSGTVVSKFEHAPIHDAFVLVRANAGADWRTRTDGRGLYKIQPPAGIYDVFVSANGFSPACRKVEVRSNEVTNFDPVLEENTLGYNSN